MQQSQNPPLVDKYLPIYFEDDLKKELKQVSDVQIAEPGEIVMDIGQRIENIPYVLEGTIKILREDEEGNEIFLYYLEPGHACATSITCCFTGQRSTIRAIAEDRTSFLSIPVFLSDEWMLKYKGWKNFVMNTYAERFEELLKAIDQLAFKKMDERLAKYLQDKAEIHGSTNIRISHQEIAYDLNTSREVVSRLLKQLERMGAIRLGRNKIELLNGEQVN
jgi:CRP/FNR family transcriptional regulator